MASTLSPSALRQLVYFDPLELGLVLKGQVDDEDVRAIFAHGKPLNFRGCPRRLVSKLVEAFTKLQKEPTYLDVKIAALYGFGVARPSEAWSEVYTTRLPCHTCTTVETVELRSIPRRRLRTLRSREPEDPVGTVDVIVEKFHVSSESFGKQLIVELHYQLFQRTVETEREQSSYIHKITIRLTNETCSTRGRLIGIGNRSSATPLLLPEFASEVFGFLDRAHVGSSLLANRALRDRLWQLKQRLPVHNLKCSFEKELLGRVSMRRPSGAYWLVIHRFRRDMAYTDVRCFKMPSTASAQNDCALIRHYLINSHVTNLRAPDDYSFTLKMLADLTRRNFSVDRVKLSAGAVRLSDYRSMDAVFGAMRMTNLDLNYAEQRFFELAKTTDFFRMPTVQSLRELKLTLINTRSGNQNPRGHARSKSPLWVSGIWLLRNCQYYQVNYASDRHLRSIERRMVRICEEFERGKITDTVKHFQFVTNASMNYSFNPSNLLVSGMEVEGTQLWERISDFEWDVYRFRNASTNEYLTACVGRYEEFSVQSILHIMKGQCYPDASFADY